MAVTTDGLVYEWVGLKADNDGTAHANADADKEYWFGNYGGRDVLLQYWDYTSDDGWVGDGSAGDPYALHSDASTSVGPRAYLTPDAALLDTTFSIEYWLCPQAYDAGGNGAWCSFASETGYGFRIMTVSSANTIFVQWGTGGAWDYYNAVVGFTPGAWAHLVLTYNSAATTLTTYWNNSKTVHGAAIAYGATAGTEVSPFFYTGYAHGSIATCRWYSKPLSDGEVSANYAAGVLAMGGNAPTVTTTAISDITATTASSGGTITDEGSAAVTAYGVCWNTTGTPTTADDHTHDEP